jgi:threonine dehydrogenase-like Zn-dependent dehydrogenase
LSPPAAAWCSVKEDLLPELIELVLSGKINPGKVFDLTLPLEQVAEGYRTMDERRAIKTLLLP